MPLAPYICQLDELISRQAPISEVRPRLDVLQANIAALEQQVAGLESKIKQVESERDLAGGMLEESVEALKVAQEELALLRGPSALEPVAAQMLKVLLESDSPCSAEEMAEKLSLDVELVKPHYATLVGRGFIQWAGLAIGSSPISNVITAAGREYVGKSGLG
jgi:hypothetical protein